MLTALVGINWGDEGKGRMVDLLAEDYQIVVRYQGGNNAGHTVINDKGEFILNLLPSGILRDNVTAVMGAGMVIDLEHLCKEINALRKKGVTVTPNRLKISDKATVCMPYDVLEDCLEEDRLADKKFGSTRRGIAYAYGNKYMKKALKTGDLLNLENAESRLREILNWKNLIFSAYGKQIDVEKTVSWMKRFAVKLQPYIIDTGIYLSSAKQSGNDILFEAQLGALRDIDYGIYPYTSSSSTIAAYAPIGAGIPSEKIDNVIGIMKAYSSCVGEGWFVSELFGKQAEILRKAGGEYGAATKRPRRVGAFDMVASKYGIKVQGANELAVTKLDVLSCFKSIPVCTAYEYQGERLEDFPVSGCRLRDCKPVIEYFDSWKEDIGKCRHLGDLPKEAIYYLKFIQSNMDMPIKYISVGPNREDIIYVDAI